MLFSFSRKILNNNNVERKLLKLVNNTFKFACSTYFAFFIEAISRLRRLSTKWHVMWMSWTSTRSSGRSRLLDRSSVCSVLFVIKSIKDIIDL